MNWYKKNKKPPKSYDLRGFTDIWSCLSRGGQIRTDDLLVPNQARYRATLHPELFIYKTNYFNTLAILT